MLGDERLEDGAASLRFRLLGPFDVSVGARSIALGGLRRRTLLAVLLVHRDEVVSLDRLIDEAWRGQPPARARDTLQAHLAHLRRSLAAGAPEVVIERRSPGYVLRAPDDSLDLTRFEHLLGLGRDALGRDHARDAADLLSAALALWTGMALDGVDDVASVVAERARLEQLRRDAVEEWAEAELRLGHESAVIPALEALVAEDPWRERATGRLMLALYRSGRQVDALAAYERLRTELAEELGLVPSPELRALEGDILRQVPSLGPAVSPAGAPDASGAPAPVGHVVVVTSGRTPTSSLPPSEGLPFVGRSAELTQLTRALRRTLRGDRVVVLVTGEAGAGKTRLVRELALAAPAQGVTVLTGRCNDEPLAPYEPFADAIVGYVDRSGADAAALSSLADVELSELARVVPRLAARLPDPEPDAAASPSATPDGFERLRFFEAVTALLRAVAPAVLVLDDLHAADTATLLLLRHVLQSSAGAPLLIVATSRVEPSPARAAGVVADAQRDGADVVRVVLDGLDRGAVETLVRAALPDTEPSPGAAVAAELWRVTDGNPFFVRELLHDLATRPEPEYVDAWVRAGRHDHLELPPTVREAVLVRVGQLPMLVRNAMQVAAVVGQEFDLDVLARILGGKPADALARVEQAVAAGVVSETAVVDRFRFAHALLRQCLLDELSASRRLRVHHLVGTALEKLRSADVVPHLGELAYHFSEAAKVADADRAVNYARLAGARAMAMLAYEEAAQHFRRALDGMGFTGDADDEARCELLLQLGDALNRAGDSVEAAEALSAAATLAAQRDDPSRLARAALAYGGYMTEPAAVDAHRVAVLEDALARVDVRTHPALRARLLARLAETLDYAPGSRARGLSNEAVRLARTTGDDAALAAALFADVTTHVVDGTEASRVAKTGELLALASRLGDPDLGARSRSWRLLGQFEVGDLDGVDQTLAELVTLAEERRQPFYVWATTAFQAMRALLVGEFDTAESLAAQALDVGQRVLPTQALRNFGTQLLAIRYYQGRLDEVAPLISDADAPYETRHVWQSVVTWIEYQVGHTDVARERLHLSGADGFAQLCASPFWSTSTALLSEVSAGVGSVADCSALYDRLAPLAHEAVVVGRSSISLGSTARFLGLLATRLSRWDTAERHFDTARRFNAAMGATPLVALTDYELARMLTLRRSTGDAARATAVASAARASARHLGMTWLADRLEPMTTVSLEETV